MNNDLRNVRVIVVYTAWFNGQRKVITKVLVNRFCQFCNCA